MFAVPSDSTSTIEALRSRTGTAQVARADYQGIFRRGQVGTLPAGPFAVSCVFVAGGVVSGTGKYSTDGLQGSGGIAVGAQTGCSAGMLYQTQIDIG